MQINFRYGLSDPLKALQRDGTFMGFPEDEEDEDEDIGQQTKDQLAHIIQVHTIHYFNIFRSCSIDSFAHIIQVHMVIYFNPNKTCFIDSFVLLHVNLQLIPFFFVRYHDVLI